MESPLLITGGYDTHIYIWYADTGEVYKKIPHNDCHINSIEISPDCMNFAVAGNPLVRFYDIYASGFDNPHPIVTYEGHTDNVTSVGYERYNRYIFTSSEDSTAKIWDLRTTGYQLYHDNNFSPIHCACLIPTNQMVLLFCDSNGQVHFWDLRANKICNTLTAEAEVGIRDICVSDDGETLCACSHTGTVHLWRLSNVGYFNYTNDNRSSLFLHTYNDDYNQSKNEKQFNQHLNVVNNNNIYDNCNSHKHDNTMFQEHNKNTNDSSKSNLHHSHCINNTYCNTNNNTEESHFVLAENIKQIVPHHGHYVLKCRFSMDGEYLATASSDGTCNLWKKHLDEFLKEHTLQGHERWVWDIRFSSDSAYILTASSDRTCKLWDVYTANKLLDYVAHQSAVTSMALLDVPLDKIYEE